ncbi:MAG: phosphonate transport system ATP-binding protein, partial [Xanthobacteraceae bacterium]
ALVQAPRILLADEPVASLDPATAERLLALMHDICKRDGLTAVVSLHQVEFARRFADRILGLSGGVVIFDGTPGQLSDDVVARLYGTPSTPSGETVSSAGLLHFPDFQTEGAS